MKTFMMMSFWLLAVSLPALIAAAPASAYVRLLPQDCHELYRSGAQRSGVYTIYPSETAPVEVYCDMGCNDDSGWTVIQKRIDGSISFHRNWESYRNGFGNKSGEYWLGLQNLHMMTHNKPYILEVEIEDQEGNKASALYKVFSVSNEESSYTLQVGSFVDGGAGDSLYYHNGQRFSTYDKDQNYYNCARVHLGGFWYNSCALTNPNGIYMGSNYYNYNYHYYYYYYNYWGINIWWATWRGSGYSLKSFTMKIRPLY